MLVVSESEDIPRKGPLVKPYMAVSSEIISIFDTTRKREVRALGEKCFILPIHVCSYCMDMCQFPISELFSVYTLSTWAGSWLGQACVRVTVHQGNGSCFVST